MSENKTIAQLLQDIDDKTADRSEILPLLKNVERNTGNATATAIGTVIKKTVGTSTKSSGNPKFQHVPLYGITDQLASFSKVFYVCFIVMLTLN